MKMAFRKLIAVQAIYTLLTAIWAIADIDSFMSLTGRKEDIWLVKTVASQLISIGVCLLLALFYKVNPLPILALSLTSSTGLAFVDFYYTSNGTIRWVYRLDGVLQTVFIIAASYLLVKFATSKQAEVH